MNFPTLLSVRVLCVPYMYNTCIVCVYAEYVYAPPYITCTECIVRCAPYRMCVKSLVDKAAFEAICDDCPHLENFCTVVEHMFIHRIQGLYYMYLTAVLYMYGLCLIVHDSCFMHVNVVAACLLYLCCHCTCMHL